MEHPKLTERQEEAVRLIAGTLIQESDNPAQCLEMLLRVTSEIKSMVSLAIALSKTESKAPQPQGNA